ncbi:methylated-DNA--[protein]-cysteine S-methyltransferase [Thorsellia kenyensis]|uniref:Methylated-DNA--[protein]-cysteine S-methyltransferase n=1 Tax=Thorsellia kenyensis TaxID=1549888 RepID=A0ABV6C847_9GAMM
MKKFTLTPSEIGLDPQNALIQNIHSIPKNEVNGLFDYCYYEGLFGKMLLASLDEHLCYVGFCNETTSHSEKTLTTLYKKEAKKNEKSPVLEKTRLALDQYFSGNSKTFNIPILLIGSAFQVTVWKSLNCIPYAKTISYHTQSIWLKNPKAIRAIASANGANPISIILPCHRVIGKNGSLTGYAGGLDLKEKLLRHEIKYTNSI